MFEKALQVFELLKRLDQFLEVLKPPWGLGGFVVLPHRGVARLLQNRFGQFDMAQTFGVFALDQIIGGWACNHTLAH